PAAIQRKAPASSFGSAPTCNGIVLIVVHYIGAASARPVPYRGRPPNRLRSHQLRTFEGPLALGSVAFSLGPLVLGSFAPILRRLRASRPAQPATPFGDPAKVAIACSI